MNRKLTIILSIITGVVIIGLFGLMISLDKIFTPEIDQDFSTIETEKDMRTVVIDNERYLQNDNDNILILVTKNSDRINKPNDDYIILDNVDDIRVLTFNTNEEKFSTLDIKANTLAYVNKLTKTGQIEDVQSTTIKSAYSLGWGSNQGCYNTLEAVRDYLFDLKFNQYVCIDYECLDLILEYLGPLEYTIPTPNLGGEYVWSYSPVTINSTSDYNALASEFVPMSQVLNDLVNKINQNPEYTLDGLYELLESFSDKLVTNCNQYTLRKIVRVLYNYDLNTNSEIEGQSTVKNDVNVYESDINDLKEKVKELFYEKRED